MKSFQLSSNLRDAALLAALGAACFIAVLVTPRTERVTTSLGSYTFANIGESFSLYAEGSHKYILFSPSPVGETNRSSTESLQDMQTSITDLYNHINRYIFYKLPWQSSIRNTVATVNPPTITFDLKGIQSPNQLTLRYGRDDVVIDGEANVITENPEHLLATLEQLVHIRLTPLAPGQRVFTASSRKLVIINPSIAGAIVIRVPIEGSITVDKDARTISFSDYSGLAVRVTPSFDNL